MLRVHRITLQALEPGAEKASGQLARRMPDAVFAPDVHDGVLEVLIPAPDAETAMNIAWAAVTAQGDTELFAVLQVPGH